MGLLSWLFGASEKANWQKRSSASEDWQSMPDHEKCQHARQLEREDAEAEAIKIYRSLLAKDFEGSFPYKRLAIIYRKRKDYDSEIKVLNHAVDRYERIVAAGKQSRPTKKLEKFKKRRDRARELSD
jgi:tetratricopeptide (TPR) repeat protein